MLNQSYSIVQPIGGIMTEEPLNSWAEFEEKITEVKQFRMEQSSDGYTSQLLYRGQPDYEWELRTTLERNDISGNYPFESYIQLASSCKSKIESLTENRWEFNRKDFITWGESNKQLFPHSINGTEYLVYLRHHGFPSPLLDWTKSPYISLFFAFNNINPHVEKVAIYIYLEFSGGLGPSIEGKQSPMVSVIHPDNLIHHRRHIIQQGAYTICTQKIANVRYCCPHESFFNPINDTRLLKLTLPSNMRDSVMDKLYEMNITEYVLYESQESLMNTLAYEHF